MRNLADQSDCMCCRASAVAGRRATDSRAAVGPRAARQRLRASGRQHGGLCRAALQSPGEPRHFGNSPAGSGDRSGAAAGRQPQDGRLARVRHTRRRACGCSTWRCRGGNSSRNAQPQVWSIDLSGAAPLQVTSVAAGVANLKVSPTGTHIAFTSEVKLDATVNGACTRTFPRLTRGSSMG